MTSQGRLQAAPTCAGLCPGQQGADPGSCGQRGRHHPHRGPGICPPTLSVQRGASSSHGPRDLPSYSERAERGVIPTQAQGSALLALSVQRGASSPHGPRDLPSYSERAERGIILSDPGKLNLTADTLLPSELTVW